MAATPSRSSMTSWCRSPQSRRRRAVCVVGPALALLLGCSATSIEKPNGSGAGSSGGTGTTTAGSPSLGGGLVTTSAARRCSDGSLKCRKVDCPADSSPSTTSVSGVVYDPAGRVPLYNAVVYVVDPAIDLVTLGERAQCESCSAHFPTKGVLAAALTKADGSFRLTDMPVGKNVPLVIQLGKWRRVITIDEVAPCTDTPLPPDQTRLPRNSTEGHLPKIAVTVGGSDALECLLKKIGIDVAEFTPDSGAGRVNLFAGYRAAKTIDVNGSSQPLSNAEDLWASSDRMLAYDMILMGCEGEGSLWKSPDKVTVDTPPPLPRPVSMQLEVRKYADLGGRIFGSHWHHRWINSDDTTPDNPYPVAGPPVASFAKSSGAVPNLTVSVDASFPKGVAFSEWLLKVGASAKPGQLWLEGVEHSVDSVDPKVARRWIYGTDEEALNGNSSRMPDMVQYFSFTTPVGAPECGRMVFSDVHVSFGGKGEGKPSDPFPERCDASPDSELTAQEKALEFMIFDLSSCIQKEDDDVSSPVTVVK
jgi:hypothetical protein